MQTPPNRISWYRDEQSQLSFSLSVCLSFSGAFLHVHPAPTDRLQFACQETKISRSSFRLIVISGIEKLQAEIQTPLVCPSEIFFNFSVSGSCESADYLSLYIWRAGLMTDLCRYWEIVWFDLFNETLTFQLIISLMVIAECALPEGAKYSLRSI